jgi:transposase InsO family protein
VIERFFGSLKSEWVKDRCYEDVESAKRDVNKYIIEYYNYGGLIPILVVFHQTNMTSPLNGVSTFTRPEQPTGSAPISPSLPQPNLLPMIKYPSPVRWLYLLFLATVWYEVQIPP